MKELTLVEWRKQGKYLYGPDVTNWKFRCPSCGNIQTIREFHDLPGAKPSDAAFTTCIGRYTGLQNGKMKASIYSSTKPCLYTLHGLINLAEIAIVDEKGKKVVCF